MFSSSSLFDNEIIDREVPAIFLCTVRNQKIRAKAYSLWKCFKAYMDMVVQEAYSPYAVNVAYAALSLHKLGIYPKQLPEDGMIVVNEKKYKIEHDSFLSLAKDFHDIAWDGIKKHRIRKDADIGKILDEINHIWNDGQNKVIHRSGNVVYAGFQE